MSYTNSPLVDCEVLSPNHSGQRTHNIKRITPHIVVGQLTAEGIGYCFDDASREASCNYAIGTEGRVCLVVPEAFRSWCSSSRDNDQQAITIECASDKTYPYAVNDVVFKKLIDLCVDVCKRNGATKLLWIADKDAALNYEPAADEMIITVHLWFSNTACPGEYLYNRLGEVAAEVTKQLNNATQIQYTQYSKEEFIEKVAEAVNAIRKEFGIEVASPIIAQACLESAYGTTNKATHNNYFGLKYRENRCPSACGTFVDGSKEQLDDGTIVPITDQWFEFETLEKGIRGYFEYTSIDRYKELKGETDPKGYLEKIKAAGYATDHEYVNKVFNVIEKWDLTKYDQKTEEPKQEEVKKYYRVRKSWEDTESQLGAYEILDYAINNCPEGYSVYDWNGVEVYSNKKEETPAANTEVTVLEWQNAAIADGFEFPLYGADGKWGDECRGVAKVAVIKERIVDGKWVWKYPNLTKLAQRLLGFTGDDIDGKCGNDTGDRIEEAQKERGLEPDRCIGLLTWEELLGV